MPDGMLSNKPPPEYIRAHSPPACSMQLMYSCIAKKLAMSVAAVWHASERPMALTSHCPAVSAAVGASAAGPNLVGAKVGGRGVGLAVGARVGVVGDLVVGNLVGSLVVGVFVGVTP